MSKRLLAVEAVTSGHPDKLADQIAACIVDAFVARDKNSRCGIEVMVKDNVVVLGGEVYSNTTIEYDEIVRLVFDIVKYPESHHLTHDDIKIINLIGKQSVEIHNAVDVSEEEIAGSDQGFMCGYATNETPTYMPLGCYITKKICNYITTKTDFGPDAKTQIVIEYDGNRPVRIDSLLISSMHECDIEELRSTLANAVLKNDIGLEDDIYTTFVIDKNFKIDINPAGEWRMGGPVSDCGMCNRKLACDQYSSASRISGGGLHGKDMSKLDLTGNLMCRYLAKNIVAAGLANTAKVDLSYSIGVVQPTSLNIELDINKELEEKLVKWVYENVSLEPYKMMKRFTYNEQALSIYASEGFYGEDGNNPEFLGILYAWEKLDLVKKLKESFGK